jgi:DNA-binding beta-propeller fold protein YncE
VRLLVLAAAFALFVVSAEARTFKGTGPRTLAVGYGAAWVGFGDGTITRIDAKSFQRRSRRLGSGMGGFSITSLATGFGSVWAAPNGPPLHRLHPRTVRVTGRIWRDGGGWTPTHVAIGAGAVWVADHRRNTVFRFDRRTRRITGRNFAPHTLRSVVASPAGVWVQTMPGPAPITGPRGARIVSRLDPTTLRLRRAFRVSCDGSLQPVGTSLWVLDHCDGTLRRFDAKTGVLTRPYATLTGAWGLTSGFGSVWVADGSSVLRIDPLRRSVVARIHVETNSVAAGAGFVWVLDSWDVAGSWLRRIDPGTNRVVGDPIRL